MYKEIFDENNELIDVVSEKDRSAAKRRAKDYAKALRKRNLSKQIYGMDWYKNLHEYSKGKIHCSCPLCAFSGETYSDMKKNVRAKQEMEVV